MVNTNTSEVLNTNFYTTIQNYVNIILNINTLNENKVNIYGDALSYWDQCLIFLSELCIVANVFQFVLLCTDCVLQFMFYILSLFAFMAQTTEQYKES